MYEIKETEKMDLGFIDKLFKSNVPYSGSLELTHRCNLSCRHCYQFQPGNRAELDTGEWIKVMEDLAAAGCLFLSFTGGEIMLRDDLPELIRAAAAMGYALTLQTNGVLLDPAMADMLEELPSTRVDVSLYGAGPASHDSLTGKEGSFASALLAVEMLRERGVPVLLKVTVGRYNIGELEGIAALGDSLGVKAVFSSTIFPRNDGDRAPTALRLGDADLERFMRFDMRYALKNLAEIMGVDADSLAYEDLTGYLRKCAVDPSMAQDGNHRLCGAGSTIIAINPYGDVYPCIAFPLMVGNVLKDNVGEIWKDSPELLELRRQEGNLPRECRDCGMLEKCAICMALSYLEEGRATSLNREKCRQTRMLVKVLEK